MINVTLFSNIIEKVYMYLGCIVFGLFAVKSTQNAESKGIIYLPAMVDYHKRKK